MTRGGKRVGAGRPEGALSVDDDLRRISISLRLPVYIVEHVKKLAKGFGVSQADVIEVALTKHYEIEKPENKNESHD